MSTTSNKTKEEKKLAAIPEQNSKEKEKVRGYEWAVDSCMAYIKDSLVNYWEGSIV